MASSVLLGGNIFRAATSTLTSYKPKRSRLVARKTYGLQRSSLWVWMGNLQRSNPGCLRSTFPGFGVLTIQTLYHPGPYVRLLISETLTLVFTEGPPRGEMELPHPPQMERAFPFWILLSLWSSAGPRNSSSVEWVPPDRDISYNVALPGYHWGLWQLYTPALSAEVAGGDPFHRSEAVRWLSSSSLDMGLLCTTPRS